MGGVFAEDDDGFYGYVQHTHDPGYSLLFATLLFCVVSYCSLPCLVAVGARLDLKNQPTQNKKKKLKRQREQALREEEAAAAAQQQTGDDIDDDRAFCLEPQDLTEAFHMQERLAPKALVSVCFNFSIAASVSSISSLAGGSSRFRRKQRQARKRNMENRHAQTEYELRMQQYDSSTTNLHQQHDDNSRPFDDDPTKNIRPVSPVTTIKEDDRSVMEPLDCDAVSMDDAVSAVEIATSPLKPKIQEKEYHKKGNIFWDALLDLVAWDLESRRLVKLAIPFAAQSCSTGVLESFTVAVIGKILGTKELAAFVVVRSMVGISSSFFGGFHESIAILGAQALGHHNYELVGQYVQLSMVLYFICYIPVVILWWIYTKNILFWFGFDEETCQIGHDYTKMYLFVELFDGIDKSIHALLDIQDHESYSTLVGISCDMVVFLDVLFTALIAKPELWVVGLIELVVGLTFIGINVCVISWNGWFSKYNGGLVGSWALYNKKAVQVMISTASSLAFGYLLTDSGWEILAIFASFLGPAEVTAWGILGIVWTAIEELTEAVADAAEVRCAFLLGSGQPEEAKLSAYKSIFLGVFLSLFLSSSVLIAGEDLSTWFTNDPALQHIITDLIPLFALGNTTLTLGTISWTLLGSQGRYRLSTSVAFVATWFVALPLAAVFTFILRVNLQGQTAAVVIGYTVSGTINAYFLFRSEWGELCTAVLEANELKYSHNLDDASSMPEQLSSNAASSSEQRTEKPLNLSSLLNQPALGT